MEKVDWRKNLKHLYGPKKGAVVEVDVPEMDFLMVDGEGDPNTSVAYREAVEALYAVSYTLKFMVREERGVDYGVMPLEGHWWMDDGNEDYEEIQADRAAWRWTVMIMQPERTTPEMLDEARSRARAKKDLPALAKMRSETLHEGRAAQTLHVGPFADEGPTIERVHGFIEERGYELTGKHHEIYLSDLRRTAPERLRTIIRQPFTD